ncbi:MULTISPECIES: ADP-ribosyl-[dinitrogen reductase] hydrolase [Anaeromyxobacter]|uniref:ADP-ribosyl-[dinitrogen reductase] hydrolase n=1 Tax=Anaeromyxobacter TaxID=161492 RepID=UPI001F582BC1|nr:MULTISPECIES: ADP-ribosyl-[dinitrogen reductase] hydrolase [unclassified Anaeromyxobacter]
MPPLSLHLPDVRDRARAAFLGAAVGDALGATVEFMTASEIRASLGVHREITGGGWLHLRPGTVTDDTEMSLCLARAIDAAGSWSLRGAADALAGWLRAGPVDVGSTCRRGLRRYMLDGTLEGPPHDGDAGNGAAVRMPPVALLSLGDPAMLRRVALEQGHLTHHHPLSDAACLLVGELVQLGCLGLSLRRLGAAAAALVTAEPRFRFAPYPGLATGYVVDTLQTVLHFFFATRSFEECLIAVVNQGGDADTTAAIAGAIAGAYHGPDAIPRRWLRRLDPGLVEELGRLSTRLVELSPVGRGAPPRV